MGRALKLLYVLWPRNENWKLLQDYIPETEAGWGNYTKLIAGKLGGIRFRGGDSEINDDDNDNGRNTNLSDIKGD